MVVAECMVFTLSSATILQWRSPVKLFCECDCDIVGRSLIMLWDEIVMRAEVMGERAGFF